MPNQTIFKFIDEKNKAQYKQMVLTWLESDFKIRGEPKDHFWRNNSTINSSFDNCEAMIGLNDKEELVSYMVWTFYEDHTRAEIDIIEVLEDYRKQGIFKKMLANFTDKVTDVCVLSASVLFNAEIAFGSVGWKSAQVPQMSKKYFKLIKPISLILNKLPKGHAIAICSEDYYKVASNPEYYAKSMQYFPIKINHEGILDEPLVAEFYYEGYIAI